MGYDEKVPPPKPEAVEVSDEDRMWSVLAHLSSFFLGIIGPLVLMLVMKERPFVVDQSREALNFQLATYIAAVVCAMSCFLVPLAIVIAIGAIVYSILAAVDASKGLNYRYPYTIRIVK